MACLSGNNNISLLGRMREAVQLFSRGDTVIARAVDLVSVG